MTTRATTRQARCSCGDLKATCEGEPVRVSICHCLACQRRTGGPFGQQARWPAERVTVTGPATLYKRTGDSGGVMTSRFCPTCGATVCYEIDRAPGLVLIPVGAFADPGFAPPTFSVYEARKHGWVVLPEGVERWD